VQRPFFSRTTWIGDEVLDSSPMIMPVSNPLTFLLKSLSPSFIDVSIEDKLSSN